VWAWVTGVVVLLLVTGGFTAYATGHLDYWFGDRSAPPPIAAPVEGFAAPAVKPAKPVARTARPGRASAQVVRRALGPAIRDPHLADLRAVVAPLAGEPVLDDGHGTSTPASTMKLLTTTAALTVLGPDHRFTTKVVAGGRHRIVLVGGGDPYLTGARPKDASTRGDASLQELARLTAAQLSGHGAVRLSYDTFLFTGPRVDPHWPQDYVPDVVSPITALWADEGRAPSGYGRVADPAESAAAQFASYLRAAGVKVAPDVEESTAPAHAREIAQVTGQPLTDVVERVLQESDNEAAEVLAHQVGLATDGDASYAGGARGVRTTLTDLGIDLGHAVIQDGSGLSRGDRLDAETLVRVLQLAASPDHPELRSVVTGLPVAGYDGTLGYRFDDSPGRGFVRAKTGTLTGTSALAGITTDARGRAWVFAFVSNHVPPALTLDARAALDRLTSALATCRC
jgi:D-alanyl-D-alanine carboxypeptidase/D-alanyl-D-alanine-endopeptidase (penicillin-binding protein 4)